MLYEVELARLDDLPKLQAATKVLGQVKSTPRYGTKTEGWIAGIWKEFVADTTLDRFIIDTTEEKAIALSAEPWVEWTAPMLEGTRWEVSLLPIVASLTLGVILIVFGMS